MTTWTIATNTVKEAMRKKVVIIFLMVALALIIFSQAFAFFAAPGGTIAAMNKAGGGVGAGNAGRVELIVIKSMAFGVIVLAGLVMSIFLGLDLIPTEVERKTIYTILSKPVRRSSYILGKQLGLGMTLAINVGLMGLAFLGLLFFKTMSIPWEIIVGVVVIFLQFFVLGSLALFFSVFLTRNINAALTFFLFIVGTLTDFVQTLGSQNAQAGNALLEKVMMIRFIIPNFAAFNINNPLIHPEQIEEIPHFYTHVFAQVIPLGLFWVFALFVATMLIFDRKEMYPPCNPLNPPNGSRC